MGTLFGVSSGVVALALAVAVPAQAAERWTGTLTRLGWDKFERQLVSPREPIAFSIASRGKTVTRFTATVWEYCEQPDVQVWEPETVDEDGTVTPGYWWSQPQPLVARFRQLTDPGPVPIARNGSFTVGVGVAGEPGSWRFQGKLRRDRFGNVVREMGGPTQIGPTVEGCTVEDPSYRATDPHWRMYGPPLPRPRVTVTKKADGFAMARVTFRVLDRKGRRVPKARVWLAKPSAHGSPEWSNRAADANGRASFSAGYGDYEVRIGGRGIGSVGCTVRVKLTGPVRHTC